MPRLSILLAALLVLPALARCGEPPEPLPTPVPRTPVPLSPDAISPENAKQVKALQCVAAGKAAQLAFSPDGTLVAITSGSWLALYDASSLSGPRFLDPAGGKPEYVQITAVAFSPDGRMLATGSGDGAIRLWDPVEGALVRTLGEHGARVIAVAFSADGQTLASAGWDSRLRVWQVTDGTLLGTFTGPEPLKRRTERPECSMPAAFSPDGALVAWACNRNLGLYRAQDGVRLRDLSIPEKVQALAFSPDGTMLAASTDKRFRIWLLRERKLTLVLEQKLGSAGGMAISPDGQLFSRGADLWSIAENRYLSQLFGGQHRGGIDAVAFAPDGALLATGSEDGIHCFWALRP